MARKPKPVKLKAAVAAADPALAADATFADKVVALDALRETRNSSQDAEVALRLQKMNADADAVWEKTSRLSLEIDVLVGKMMQQWTSDSTTYATNLGKISADIDTAVGKIKKSQDTAKSVAAVLGAIDQALAIAARLLI